LVLIELLSNIINYGYLDKTKSEIFIQCCIFQNYIQFVIEDYGIEFNPLSAPEHVFPQTIEQANVGGLGLHLVRNYVDKSSYVREQKKNIFTIVFFR
jgi:anti-sigma regulatory factor (Ser/Thr protein kinase)